VTLLGNYSSGNYNAITIGGKLNCIYNRKHNLAELTSAYRYTKIDDKCSPKEDEKYALFSYSHRVNNIKIIGVSENEISYVRQIDLRATIGSGFGYKFINTKKTELEISEVLLFEDIKYYNKEYNISTLRYSTRIKFTYTNYPFNFSTIWLVQPPIWQTQPISPINNGYKDNFNMRSNTTIDINLSKKIVIGISDEFIMQTYVKQFGKKPADNSVNFYIKYSF